MRVYMLGAGASKSYNSSPTNLKMPLANEIFKTMNSLGISENPWFFVGSFIHYMDHYHQITPDEMYEYNEDIEIVYTEIEERLNKAINEDSFNDISKTSNAYNNLVSILNSIINEIQNGPICEVHNKLVNALEEGDSIITFNWDTLVDRSLFNSGKWFVDSGYSIKPQSVYRNGWEQSMEKESKYKLLKLHGSTNWLTSYRVFNLQNKEFEFIHNSSNSNFYIYESTIDPYSCFKGRYMDGYQPFSYGYYPPNIPEPGKAAPEGYVMLTINPHESNYPKGEASNHLLPSMPIIIKPVKNKSYLAYGELFKKLWDDAEQELVIADEIVIIGYSFPVTDVMTTELFINAFCKRKTLPKIIIINPNSRNIEVKFELELGIPKRNIKVINEYVNENFNFDL